MGEREFLIYLDPVTRLSRYRHYHVAQGSNIVEFRIQLEIMVAGIWYAVVRYDTAHGRPHRDILHPNGSQTKEWLDGYTTAGALTFGQRDIMKNWQVYRDRFLKEMNYE
ncbi:MAG: hypothetical protein Q8L87_01515 [Anaerolineales bacterium]|jgi:hypothetical protein|nr:hypothetical protein [Anaerolineales bacterium]